MDSSVGKKQLLAIFLTDVVNFSDQAGRREEVTLRQLEMDLDLIRKFCRERGGEVLKSTGDGILACFASSERALEAAEEVQKELLQQKNHLVHRIGIHIGDVYRQDADILGDGVNLTARLTDLAEPGGLCVSESLHNSVRSRHAAFHIRPTRTKVRNAPKDFRAYHFRPASLARFFQPTWGQRISDALVLALVASFFISPTLIGWEALAPANFRPDPILVAGISIAQYPAGFFLGFAVLRALRQSGRRNYPRRVALGFSVYAGMAAFLLCLLATSAPTPSLPPFWPWLFLGQAALAGIGGLATFLPRLWLGLALCLCQAMVSPGHAQLQPSLAEFQSRWGSPLRTGYDSVGRWREFKRSREWTKVWSDRENVVVQIQYRLPDYEACWTEDRLGQKAEATGPDRAGQSVKLWERDFDPPFRSPTPRFSTEYWMQRNHEKGEVMARAMVANELTSIWMLPPFLILSPVITDLGRPITLLIRDPLRLPPNPPPAKVSVAANRKNLGS